MCPDDARALWLSRFILPHEPALRAWLRRRNAPGIEIDDVVQETYARLSELDSVDAIRNPRTYLFQTAYSIVVTQLRRSRIVPIVAVDHLEAFEMPSAEPDPERQTHDHQELERLARAIANLPRKVREVFILRRVHDLSQREVAKALGLAESTVEKHISKAFRLLAETFAHGGNLRSQTSNGQEKPISRTSNVPDQSRD